MYVCFSSAGSPDVPCRLPLSLSLSLSLERKSHDLSLFKTCTNRICRIRTEQRHPKRYSKRGWIYVSTNFIRRRARVLSPFIASPASVVRLFSWRSRSSNRDETTRMPFSSFVRNEAAASIELNSNTSETTSRRSRRVAASFHEPACSFFGYSNTHGTFDGAEEPTDAPLFPTREGGWLIRV